MFVSLGSDLTQSVVFSAKGQAEEREAIKRPSASKWLQLPPSVRSIRNLFTCKLMHICQGGYRYNLTLQLEGTSVPAAATVFNHECGSSSGRCCFLFICYQNCVKINQ